MADPLDRILVVPDVHRPYHDKKAWATMLRAAKRFCPNKIIVLGDFVDFYAVSDHDKDPARKYKLVDELKSGREGLEELEDLGAEQLFFDCGNHEDRLNRYLVRRAPELHDLISVQDSFELKEHGWKFQKYGTHSNIGKLYHTHDVGYAGKHAVFHTGSAFQRSVVFGHTHRLSVNYFGSVDGKRHFAASLGWLGDIDAADYMPQAKKAEWQLGFGIVRAEKSGNIHLQAIPIVDGKCVLEGSLA